MSNGWTRYSLSSRWRATLEKLLAQAECELQDERDAFHRRARDIPRRLDKRVNSLLAGLDVPQFSTQLALRIAWLETKSTHPKRIARYLAARPDLTWRDKTIRDRGDICIITGRRDLLYSKGDSKSRKRQKRKALLSEKSFAERRKERSRTSRRKKFSKRRCATISKVIECRDGAFVLTSIYLLCILSNSSLSSSRRNVLRFQLDGNHSLLDLVDCCVRRGCSIQE